MLLVRSVWFTILVPGTVTVLVPYLIVSRSQPLAPEDWRIPQFLGAVPIALGASILLRCIRDFAVIGRGILAPIDPPKKLVVQGLYRYVRNPMYLSGLTLLVGEALFFQSAPLLAWAIGWFGLINLMVLRYEEPNLRRRFGKSYERYCGSVHRWLPGKPSGLSAQGSDTEIEH